MLNEIIEKHKSQPVGDGYIDIIVSRDNYREFVSELIGNDFVIESISWWSGFQKVMKTCMDWEDLKAIFTMDGFQNYGWTLMTLSFQ